MSTSKAKRLERYILENAMNGYFNTVKAKKQYRVYRNLQSGTLTRLEWAKQIGFDDKTLSDEDVASLTKAYNELEKDKRNRQNARREQRETNRKGRLKDNRSIRDERGRFGKWVPRSLPNPNRDPETGRFISKTEYEKLLRLTILNNKRNTPEREKEREDLTNNLQNTQRTVRQNRLEEAQHRRLQTARNEVAEIQGVLEEQEIQLQEMENATSSSSRILDDIRDKKAVVNRLREMLKNANEEVIRLQNELLRGPTELDEMADGDSNRGGGFDDDDDNFGNEGGTYNAGTTTTTTTRTVNQQTIEQSLGNLYLVGNWSAQTEIDGIRRRPLKLRTVLKWIQNWTQVKLCDGVKRLKYNAKRRPSSWYTEFKQFTNEQAFNIVQNRDNINENTFGLPNERIMWATKDRIMNSNSRISNNIEMLPAKQAAPNELNPVLLKDMNDDAFITFRNGNFIKTWIGQASGVTVDTVIMVTSSVERQMIDGATVRENGGWVGTDYWELEKYEIPIRKLFEAMFYMLAYQKGKARIVSIYDPHPIITAVVELLSNKFDDGIPNGLLVYKPWFDYENDRAVTLVNKPKTQLMHAWYRWCWNADFNDNFNLGDMEAYFSANRNNRWKAARFGRPNDNNLRRYAYDRGIEEIDRIYRAFIVNWGGGGGGQQVLDSIADDLPRAGVDDPDQEPENEASTLNNPLIEFERIDEVFTVENLRNVVQNFIDTMKGENYDYNVNLPIDRLVSSMKTAFATEKQRGVKRGVVSRVLNDQITVQWELPYGVFDANPVPVVQTYTKDDILRNHRLVAAFLLTKIGRMKTPMKFNTDISLSDYLRSGNLLNWSKDKIHTFLHDSVQKDFVTFEIDLTTVSGNNEELWNEVIQDMLIRFRNKVELINTDRPCDGRSYRDPDYMNNEGRRHVWSGDPLILEENRPEEKLTVSKEVKRELDSIKDFFRREDVAVQECVNRYCSVVERGTNF